MNRGEFLRDLGKHLGEERVKLTTAERKALWQTIGRHDDAADICYFTSGPKKGQIEPDPALRDTENIPFGWGGHRKPTTRPRRRSTRTSRPRSSPMFLTPRRGSTRPRRRPATRSRSPGASTSTSRRGLLRRSTPTLTAFGEILEMLREVEA